MSHTANFLESISRSYGFTNIFSDSTDYSVNGAIPVDNTKPVKMEVEKNIKEANELLEKYKIYYKLYEESLDLKIKINKRLDELEKNGQSYSREYSLSNEELNIETERTIQINNKLSDILTCLKALGYTTKIDFSKNTHILIEI